MSGGGEGNLDVDIFDLLSEKETYFTLHTRQMSKGEKITQLVDYSNKINDEILKRQRLLNNTNSANNKNKLVEEIDELNRYKESFKKILKVSSNN